MGIFPHSWAYTWKDKNNEDVVLNETFVKDAAGVQERQDPPRLGRPRRLHKGGREAALVLKGGDCSTKYTTPHVFSLCDCVQCGGGNRDFHSCRDWPKDARLWRNSSQAPGPGARTRMAGSLALGSGRAATLTLLARGLRGVACSAVGGFARLSKATAGQGQGQGCGMFAHWQHFVSLLKDFAGKGQVLPQDLEGQHETGRKV